MVTSRVIRTKLIAFLNAMVESPILQALLILDDAHLLTDGGELPLILNRLIGLAPAQFHVLLSGHPTLSLPTLTC